jgi:hypothetical protein
MFGHSLTVMISDPRRQSIKNKFIIWGGHVFTCSFIDNHYFDFFLKTDWIFKKNIKVMIVVEKN